MKTLVQTAKKTISKYEMLSGGETVLVGVSGGPDSLALLHILSEVTPAYKLKLHVFHLNHMMRGQAAEDDAKFVGAVAKKLGISVTVLAADVLSYVAENDVSPENGARQVRHELLRQVADEIGAQVIALGHTADDQVETFLMRIIRGTGLDGLRSIPPVNGAVIRPLIEAARTDVEEYCAKNGLRPRQDETNDEISIFRNRIRHELIPLLEIDYNPAICEEILREVETVDGDVSLLEELAEQSWTENVSYSQGTLNIDRAGFIKLPLALKRRVIRMAAEELDGKPTALSFQNVSDIIEKIVMGKTGAALDLPGGISIRREYDTIVMTADDEIPADETPQWLERAVLVPGLTDLASQKLAIQVSYAEPAVVNKTSGPDVAFLDAAKAKGNIKVRPPREGDTFHPLGLKGTKKLSDFFIDEKITRQVRRSAPIVEAQGKIIWVAGYQIDDRCRVTEKTKRVMVLRLLRGSR